MLGEEIRSALLQIISLIILAMPLFLLPAALKLSGSILGRINDLTKGGAKKFGGDQVEGLRKNKMKQAYGNSRLAGALGYRKSMREFHAATRRGRTPDWINTAMGGKGYADSARRRAAGYVQKEELDAINDAAAQQSHMTNAQLTQIANGNVKEFEDKDGQRRKVSNYSRIAAARQVIDTGNYAERLQIYDSVKSKAQLIAEHGEAEGSQMFQEQQMLRKQISDGLFKRGDTSTLHPQYGGQVLTGDSGGKTGRIKAVAKSIADGRIKAKGLVHDARETEDVLEVLKNIQSDPTRYLEEYDMNPTDDDPVKQAQKRAKVQANIRAMSEVAYEALHGEETRGDAIIPGFKASLEPIAAMYPLPTPGSGGGPGGSGGTP